MSGSREIGIRQAARAARAFGDILAGQLEVHAAQVAALAAVH